MVILKFLFLEYITPLVSWRNLLLIFLIKVWKTKTKT